MASAPSAPSSGSSVPLAKEHGCLLQLNSSPGASAVKYGDSGGAEAIRVVQPCNQSCAPDSNSNSASGVSRDKESGYKFVSVGPGLADCSSPNRTASAPFGKPAMLDNDSFGEDRSFELPASPGITQLEHAMHQGMPMAAPEARDCKTFGAAMGSAGEAEAGAGSTKENHKAASISTMPCRPTLLHQRDGATASVDAILLPAQNLKTSCGLHAHNVAHEWWLQQQQQQHQSRNQQVTMSNRPSPTPGQHHRRGPMSVGCLPLLQARAESTKNATPCVPLVSGEADKNARPHLSLFPGTCSTSPTPLSPLVPREASASSPPDPPLAPGEATASPPKHSPLVPREATASPPNHSPLVPAEATASPPQHSPLVPAGATASPPKHSPLSPGEATASPPTHSPLVPGEATASPHLPHPPEAAIQCAAQSASSGHEQFALRGAQTVGPASWTSSTQHLKSRQGSWSAGQLPLMPACPEPRATPGARSPLCPGEATQGTTSLEAPMSRGAPNQAGSAGRSPRSCHSRAWAQNSSGRGLECPGVGSPPGPGRTAHVMSASAPHAGLPHRLIQRELSESAVDSQRRRRQTEPSMERSLSAIEGVGATLHRRHGSMGLHSPLRTQGSVTSPSLTEARRAAHSPLQTHGHVTSPSLTEARLTVHSPLRTQGHVTSPSLAEVRLTSPLQARERRKQESPLERRRRRSYEAGRRDGASLEESWGRLNSLIISSPGQSGHNHQAVFPGTTLVHQPRPLRTTSTCACDPPGLQ